MYYKDKLMYYKDNYYKDKLSCTFYHALLLKVKLVAKYFLETKACQNKLLLPIFNLVKFLLRPKNECVALVDFKLSAALNT